MLKKRVAVAALLFAEAVLCVSAVAGGPDMGVPSTPCSKLGSGELGLSLAYNVCMKKGAGNLGLESECTGKEWDRLDAQLNTSYQAALKRLNATRSVALRESQRAWLALRRPHCILEVPETGGSQDKSDEQQCALQVLAYRVCYLQQLEE